MTLKNSYESIKRYEDKSYDFFRLRFHKGERERLKKYLEPSERSMNSFIIEAIWEKMERETRK